MRAVSSQAFSHTQLPRDHQPRSDFALPSPFEAIGWPLQAPMVEGNPAILSHESLPREIAQDAAQYSKTSTEFWNAWKAVNILRDRLFRQRLLLKERRNELSQERLELAAVDTKFMNYVRQFWESDVHPDPAYAQNLYADLQSKRDEIGALQYDYDTAEADHDIAEARFEEEDQRLNELFSKLQGRQHSSEMRSDDSESDDLGVPPRVMKLAQDFDRPQPDHSQLRSRDDTADDSLGLAMDPLSNLDSRPRTPDHLQIELWVQDAINNNIPNTDSRVNIRPLKRARSDPSEPDKTMLQPRSSQMKRRNIPLDLETELQTRQLFEIRSGTRSESELAPLRRQFDESRPRITSWILRTFGSSTVDYIRRARDETLFSRMQDTTTNDEQWARLVFDYWKRNRTSKSPSEASWDEVSTPELPEHKHPRRLTVGNSHLLLSSELSKARYTLENTNRLFPPSPSARAIPNKSNSSISDTLDHTSQFKPQSI